jgi:NADP-dependent 3-hydroxy acid dehydrogenase YdfG
MERVLREGAFLGETHIVTGAAEGIGHAVATALSEPRISGYTTGQVVQASGGMYLA